MLGGIAMSVTFDHYLKPDEITTAAREPKPVKAKGKIGMRPFWRSVTNKSTLHRYCIGKLLYGLSAIAYRSGKVSK